MERDFSIKLDTLRAQVNSMANSINLLSSRRSSDEAEQEEDIATGRSTSASSRPSATPMTRPFAVRAPTPMADPVAPTYENLRDGYKLIRKSVSGSSTSFPSSEGCGFGKEERNCVSHLRRTFKVLKVIHQLCAAASDGTFATQDALDDIEACVEYANHLQIAHRDEIWLCKAGGDEAFQAFQVLEGSTLSDDRQQRFLNTVQLVGQKKPPQQRANTSATRGESSNRRAHWRQNRGQPPCTFRSGAPAQPSVSMYG